MGASRHEAPDNMSQEIHVHEHSSPIKTPKQLIAVVVLAFAIPIAIISVLAHLATSGGHAEKGSPAMSEDAIAKRLKAVGEVVVDPNQPKPAPAAPVAVAAAPAPAAGAPAAAKGGDSGKGKSVYDTACTACHAAGVAGAPKAGDKAAWAPRDQVRDGGPLHLGAQGQERHAAQGRQPVAAGRRREGSGGLSRRPRQMRRDG